MTVDVTARKGAKVVFPHFKRTQYIVPGVEVLDDVSFAGYDWYVYTTSRNAEKCNFYTTVINDRVVGVNVADEIFLDTEEAQAIMESLKFDIEATETEE